MWSRIQSRLGEYYRPAQISGRLQPALGVEISPQTICRHIWADKKNGGEVYNFWRTKGRKYRSRGRKKAIGGRSRIDDEKSRIGNGEIETVIGQNHQPAFVTIIERKSKLTVMKKVENQTAELVAVTTIKLLRPDKDRILTITSDRGKEFAYHEKVANVLEWDYYLAHPDSSWEQGLNENTNGWIRHFFPQGSRFEEITERSVKKVKGLLHRRPRKSLGLATPIEAFFGKSFGENFAF